MSILRYLLLLFPTLAFHRVVLVKIGGSSITHKAVQETLNETAVEWLAQTLSTETCGTSVILVHGAGSFGHHHAKEYGLRGQTEPPPPDSKQQPLDERTQQGLVQTRQSVQTLNQHIVRALIDAGVPAVAISPCFAFLEAHGGSDRLLQVLQQTLHAGLVPVLHGDACLYGSQGAGILSGDTLMALIGAAPWVDEAIFWTDVPGVYTKDPRVDPDATLVRELASLDGIEASGSSHAQDVTGGLATKLAAAWSIVESGKNVSISQAGTQSAEQSFLGEPMDEGTVLYDPRVS